MSRNTNRASRGGNFTRDEIDSLLDSVEEVMPLGMDEWTIVERRHSAKYPERNRTKESLCRKFQQLYLTKQPTGSPDCPQEIRRAKELMNVIREKAEVSSGGSVSSEEPSAPAEDEEQEPQDVADPSNLVETTESETTANEPARPASQRPLGAPLSRAGTRKKRKSSDDDDISMKDMLKYSMMQQEKDRQMMMQMMTMAMMSIVSSNSGGGGGGGGGRNELMSQMMASFVAQQQQPATGVPPGGPAAAAAAAAVTENVSTTNADNNGDDISSDSD